MSKTKSYTYLISFGITDGHTGRCVHTTHKRISTAQDVREVEKHIHEMLGLKSNCEVALYSFSLMSGEVSNDN